ncbi:MAG: tRNA uridine-5-carboxymethylaminomethyl(34) synthesis GTPase MnmE [Vicinamibacterales bacterium]
MFSTDDTIVAIATAPGRGAIGIIRLSGPASRSIARRLTGREGFEPRYATTTRLTAGDLEDTVVVTSFPAPASYTGEDVIEIGAHGSGVVLRGIVKAAIAEGARLAAPGEFTLRAFLNGKIDLAQAEAIADLIDAATPMQARAAFDQLSGTLSSKVARIDAELFDLMARLEASIDFPDEGYHFIEPHHVESSLTRIADEIDAILSSAARGRLIREGAQVVLAGEPNVGKSSLFNALVGSHRAIVTDIAGTTRDLVTEIVDVRGVRVTLVDTAGLSESNDPVEREGIARTRGALGVADLVLCVADSDTALDHARRACHHIDPSRLLIVASKADVDMGWAPADAVRVSSVTGQGLDALIDGIFDKLTGGERAADTPEISNVRHITLLTNATAVLRSVVAGMADRGAVPSEEFVLADLQQARALLESVTGQRSSDDTLIHIFERFCVGK